MAGIKDHNDIIKIVFNGNKHLKHVMSDPEIRQMTFIENRWPATKSPVCGHCEKLGLWSKDTLTNKPIGVCKSCGTITKNPVTYATYLASKMDVDATGHTFRSIALADREKDNENREIYLPDCHYLESS